MRRRPSKKNPKKIPTRPRAPPKPPYNDTFGINAIDTSNFPILPGDDIESMTFQAHDETVPRAQLDTGAFASCTNQQHLLHNYRAFGPSFPSPVRLLPATDGSDAVPEGFGYLHVPAACHDGYIAVRTFYHPSLRTTVIDERDFIKGLGSQKRDFRGETIEKHYRTGTFTYTCYHVDKPRNIVVGGVLINDKCYTHELIAPVLPPDHPAATPLNSIPLAMDEDPEFRDAVERATIFYIHSWQEDAYARIRAELSVLPISMHQLPFHEHIAQNTPVNAIKQATERLLWHQRLGHPSPYYLRNAHKHIKGVPKFSNFDDLFDQCPTCLRAKLIKQPAGPNPTRTATVPFQGLSIDFSFAGLKSKNEAREVDYLGLKQETCWILISDHFTRYLVGDTRRTKASPIHWLRDFLTKHSPTCPDKYVFLDQGGELYHNPEVTTLFKKFGYDIYPTGADASHQNGPVERAHRTVADSIRTFLIGANLPIKFWPYAFHHSLRIRNSTPSRDQEIAPLKLAFDRVDDFTHFRTFGCRVWVRPPGERPAKFRPNPRKGIFLGFMPNTTRNILWYDEETHHVNIATHVRFDEGMNDLPHDMLPPNVTHLQRLQAGDPIPIEQHPVSVPQLVFTPSPFTSQLDYQLHVKCAHPTYGFELSTDDLLQRVYVSHIAPRSSAENLHSTPKATSNKLRGSFITSINDAQVFSIADAQRQFSILRERHADSFFITLAPERHLTAKQQRKAVIEHDIFKPYDPEQDPTHTPALTVDVLRSIGILHAPPDRPIGNTVGLFHDDEQMKDFFDSMDPEFDYHDDTPINDIADITLHSIRILINAITSSSITPEEQALGHLTRRRLKQLDTWPLWLAGERKQLDNFAALDMFGKPIPRPPNAIVLRSHWRYGIKRDGTRRPRHCCDGSKRAAPLLHRLAKTYSACVSQPVQRLFLALAAALNYLIYGGDARDAYAHSPSSTIPTYLSLDEQYIEWYFERYGIQLDPSLVLPIQHAMQGNPEAGRLWETHANKILADLGFTTTTHDRSIYTANIDGIQVLLLRQVDDFAIACPSESIATSIFDAIGTRLQIATETTVPFKYMGLLSDFNGVNVDQYRDSISVSVSSYIDRIMQTHGWTTPIQVSTRIPQAPIPDDAISSMFNHVGPSEDSPEHAALTLKHGFKYRSLLGELLYAYVTCRPDIGYAIVTLSKFASCPHDVHFSLLRSVARYLRETKHWGITFHRSGIQSDLPSNPMAFLPPDASLPPFPQPATPTSLTCFVDAAHGNDMSTRRSTTGYVFMMSGGAVSYRCTTQSVTATSSTEAEFIAAVTAAKQARYLRFILKELGFTQTEATPIYEDNMSAINMINSRIPTERSRHIDIQFFAIQEWKEIGDIDMRHIPGIINNADDMTKPLGWILHHRHARRTLGHYSLFSSFVSPSTSLSATEPSSDASIGGGYWPNPPPVPPVPKGDETFTPLQGSDTK